MQQTKPTRQYKSGGMNKVSELRDPRFDYVALASDKLHIVCKLDTGVLYELPVALFSIAETYDGTPPSTVDTIEEGAAAVLRLKSGVQLDFPVDFVLHHCEPAYSHYVGKHDAPSRIGKQVRSIRLAKKLTLAQLAEKTGIAEPNLSRVEHGKHTPSLNTLHSIAKGLNVSTRLLLSGNFANPCQSIR